MIREMSNMEQSQEILMLSLAGFIKLTTCMLKKVGEGATLRGRAKKAPWWGSALTDGRERAKITRGTVGVRVLRWGAKGYHSRLNLEVKGRGGCRETERGSKL